MARGSGTFRSARNLNLPEGRALLAAMRWLGASSVEGLDGWHGVLVVRYTYRYGEFGPGIETNCCEV